MRLNPCMVLYLDQDVDPGVKLRPQKYNYNQQGISVGWYQIYKSRNLKLGIRQARPNGIMNRN